MRLRDLSLRKRCHDDICDKNTALSEKQYCKSGTGRGREISAGS